MLILARKPGQKIVIPRLGITITLIDIRENGTARIGIEAPLEQPVHREEVWVAICNGDTPSTGGG